MKRHRIGLAAAGSVVALTCVSLGMWQLARLADRRADNRRLLARVAEPVLTLNETASFRGGRDDPMAYRRARATGNYDPSNEVLLRARSLDGRAGNHVLTPLLLGDGRAIVVDRGWIPIEIVEPDDPRIAAAAGAVGVTGILQPSDPKPIAFGPRDPPSGRLKTIGRIDLERLAKQIPYPIEPLALALEEQAPPSRDLPKPAGLPAPGDGPHLAYAVQWFLFALIAMITTVLLIRREPKAAAEGR